MRIAGACAALLLLTVPVRADIDTLVRDAVRLWRVPGAAVAVVHGDKIHYLEGRGIRAIGPNQPVTADTLFPLASCTKAFTTTAMALLVDEGRLSWDDPVRKHLPSFRLADPHADAEVRLRDLVSHRTGVRGHDLLWYRAPWSQEEQIRRIGLVPLDRPFRSTFQYQSTMFTAAGHAAASAAGTSWAELVRKRLLDPLGMKATVLTSTEAEKVADDRAAPHRQGRDGIVDGIASYPMPVPDPAGSVHTSARDLTRWLRFHLAEGAFEGRRLVRAESLRETHTPQIVLRREGLARELNPETNLMSYGMGWLVRDYRGHLLLEHAGLIDGFRAHLTLVPKSQFGIAILTNLHQTRMNLALSNAVVDDLLGLPPKDWNGLLAALERREEQAAQAKLQERLARRRPDLLPSVQLAACAGSYESPAYGSARLTLEKGRLILRWSSFAVALEHFAGDTFVAPDEWLGTPEVDFVVKENRVVALNLGEPLKVEFRRKE